MSEKIKISWDEVHSSEVDEKIKQQEMLDRAGQHQQHVLNSAGLPVLDANNPLYIQWVYLGLFGLVFGVAAWLISEVLFSLEASGAGMCWAVCICLFVGFGISVAESVVSRNWDQAIRQGSLAACLCVFGGTIGMFTAGIFFAIAILIGGGEDINLFLLMLARGFGWAIFGLFVAIAPGISMMSGKKLLLGLLGGAIGGLIGGMLFDPIAGIGGEEQGDTFVILSRFVGICCFSVLTGVAMGILEDAAKQGWLKVAAGVIAGKQFILYKNPTFIGSSPKCEIYLFKDPTVMPQHAAVTEIRGNYTLEPLGPECPVMVNGQPLQRPQKLDNGDRIIIGATQFVFGLKEKKK